MYDIILQSRSKAQRALADSSELADIQNYINANEKHRINNCLVLQKVATSSLFRWSRYKVLSLTTL
ncbi:hypothetical protein JS44_15765 [Anoxybacillus flavithermus]|uniref:Uncharacterized protein n=1 Tax=Anoxybacillus flavithermus TaxID=33934 RepID=A0A094LBA1_9BACL|nr:hypothetical protein JS44_15765 [Anoxybacillus flavithermus]